jgi:translocation and assembly module TamA
MELDGGTALPVPPPSHPHPATSTPPTVPPNRLRPARLAAAVQALAAVLTLASLPAWGQLPVQVRLEGLSSKLEENARLFLSVEQEKDAEGLTEARLRRLHERAPEEIRRALQPFGYYRAQVDPSLVHEDGKWRARYRVTPGKPVLIKALDVAYVGPGADDPALTERARAFPLVPGDVLVHARYEQGKKDLLSAARERGYLDVAPVEARVRVWPEEERAQVVLHIDTGPRYFLGEVRLHQDILDPGFVRRFVPYPEGEPLSSRVLLGIQAGLSQSGYFSYAEVNPRVTQAQDGRVPVEVDLGIRPRHRYTFGLGFGTINRLGHRLGADLELSTVRQGISGRYTLPLERPLTDSLSFTASYVQEQPDTSRSTTLLLGASHQTKRGKWLRTLFVNAQRESFEVGEDEDVTSLVIGGGRLSRTRANDPIFPTRGNRLSLELKGASSVLLSDIDLVQATLGAKQIWPLGGRGRLLVRSEVGATWVSDFDQLPATQRFFAGGDKSVRGYDYQALGPEDDNGEVLGGRYLAVASVEADYRFLEKWGMAIFLDAGNAFDEPSNQVIEQLALGGGLGARWISPVGLVRVDIAAALDEPGTPLRLHVSIGPDL